MNAMQYDWVYVARKRKPASVSDQIGSNRRCQWKPESSTGRRKSGQTTTKKLGGTTKPNQTPPPPKKKQNNNNQPYSMRNGDDRKATSPFLFLSRKMEARKHDWMDCRGYAHYIISRKCTASCFTALRIWEARISLTVTRNAPPLLLFRKKKEPTRRVCVCVCVQKWEAHTHRQSKQKTQTDSHYAVASAPHCTHAHPFVSSETSQASSC